MRERNWQVLSGFVLKIIALVTMTLDHIGIFLLQIGGYYQLGITFRAIGRLAFPLFVMLLAEGVRYTKRPWRYFLRLLVMDVAIKLGMTIYFYAINPNSSPGPYTSHGNAFADLTMIALMLILLKQKGWKKLLALIPAGVGILTFVIQLYEVTQGRVLWFPSYLRADYSLLGLLIGLGFYFAYPIADRLGKPLREAISIPKEEYRETNAYRKLVNGTGAFLFFVVTLVMWGVSYITYPGSPVARPFDYLDMSLQTYSLLVIPLLYLYSGKRGYDSKPMRWITYLYYPVHMAILLAIFWL